MKSPLASKSLLNGVAQAGKRLIAVGKRGHILYSSDSGKTWQQANVPVSSDLTAVHFASPLKGWAVGHDGVVLKTEDGGSTWVKQLDGREIGKIMTDYYAQRSTGPHNNAALQEQASRFAEEGADKPFLGVWFENDMVGYVVGAFGMIFRTEDGGKRWTPWFERTENPDYRHFMAIASVGDALYLAGEQGMVLRLDKVAQRFRAVPVDYNGTFFTIAGRNGNVLVSGLRGALFRSENGGVSWEKVKTDVAGAITGASSTEDGRIALVSQAGDVLLSADDGKTFITQPGSRGVPASAVTSADLRSLVMVGARGAHIHQLK
ncbi:WD40/YVTN/BNR-like repeat-containing protein [Noviherbaspirillum sedimenti]|uniref:Glycosyl hydrolase n=1 Tax=Noviherbaspirillum sedimenti TaxID=2320865 RepID=A0A3A3GQB0_9BURK|nr:YCF48-related protein [Noviherbaspirillum sedimenti]RJG04536.1 glycosyl hydrolase [Noviherbaspirillum sedimenti]